MVDISSIQVSLYAGSGTPSAVPNYVIEALGRIEVTNDALGRSGFVLELAADLAEASEDDYELVTSKLFDPFGRVIVTLSIGNEITVLADGFITNVELDVRNGGATTLSVFGEDASVMMDLEEKIVSHFEQDAPTIVKAVLGAYSQYGVTPVVEANPPAKPVDQTVQRGSDLEYLQRLARLFGYVFYVSPGKSRGKVDAYWGPPKLTKAQPQPALSVLAGTESNVQNIHFSYDALAPTKVSGKSDDAQPVDITATTWDALSSGGALSKQTKARTRLIAGAGGLSNVQAKAIAQGWTDTGQHGAIKATGDLNVLDYGTVLRAGALVDVRGAGKTYDGTYYVQRVNTMVTLGEVTQRFELSRGGLGSTITKVRAS